MLVKRWNKYYIVKTINRKKKWIATGKSSRAEAEMLERALSIIKDGQRDKFVKVVSALYDDAPALDRIDIGDLMEEYPRLADTLGIRVSAETMRKRRNILGRFSVWSEAHTRGIKYADDVTIPIAWRFIESLDKATVNTRHKLAGELASIWEALLKRGVVASNPWKTAKPQKDASLQKHGRAFSMDEVRALLSVCRSEWIRHTIIIGLYTGLRIGDIFALRWEHLDFENNVIRSFKPSKTSRHDIEVTIPLHEVLRAYLSPIRELSGKVIVATCRPDQFGEFYFTKLIEEAGIKSDARTKLSFHCLRHTFATLLAKSGATESERMRLGGWTSVTTASIYNHDDTAERKIIATLPSL